MINTVTLNPALDYFIEVDSLHRGKTNRAENTFVSLGGKGINVAVVAKRLGIPSRATGFLSGFTGEHIASEIERMAIENHFIRTEGLTRINIKLKENTEQIETELNGTGVLLAEQHLKRLFDKIGALPDGEFLVLSGNVPSSMSPIIYAEIMDRFAHKNFQIVLDTSGKAFAEAISLKPFLIKPNLQELEEHFGRLIDRADAPKYCKKLQMLGARNVLLSLGADGAVLLTEDGELFQQAAAIGKLVASSGAGDSMVAGFLAGWIETRDHAYSLKLGAAAGGATAFSQGLAEKELIHRIFNEIS